MDAEVVEVQTISKTEAQELTDNIKEMSEELWHMLLDAYERGVHIALGYTTWGAYFEAEFGQSGRHGQRLLAAARVARIIEGSNDQMVVEQKPNEFQSRELSSLIRDNPEAVAEAWQEVIEKHGKDATGAEVRKIVQSKKAQEETPDVWTAEERELLAALRNGRTIVVNMHERGPHTNLVPWLWGTNQLIRVDRASKWGNPFEIPDDGDRDAVIRKYTDYYLPHKPMLLDKLSTLKGKALGCWCAPKACHGDILKEGSEA